MQRNGEREFWSYPAPPPARSVHGHIFYRAHVLQACENVPGLVAGGSMPIDPPGSAEWGGDEQHINMVDERLLTRIPGDGSQLQRRLRHMGAPSPLSANAML